MTLRWVWAVAGFLVVSATGAEAEAPFGLTWGMTDRAFHDLGLRTLGIEEPAPGLRRIYFAPGDRLPAETLAVSVVIDGRHGLQKVWWRGRPVADDPYGDRGRAAYAAVRDLLVDRYGDPEDESTFSGRFVFTDPAEFWDCLSYTGCGAWMAFWYPEGGGAVHLRLFPAGRGSGHVDVVYEGPDWGRVDG